MYWIQTHEKQKAQQGVPPYSAQGALPVTADVVLIYIEKANGLG